MPKSAAETLETTIQGLGLRVLSKLGLCRNDMGIIIWDSIGAMGIIVWDYIGLV